MKKRIIIIIIIIEIFPIFSKSYVVRQLVRQLVHQVCYTRYQVSSYLWWIESVIKYVKVPKYYDQDCRLIRMCTIQWWCSLFLFKTRNTIFVQIWLEAENRTNYLFSFHPNCLKAFKVTNWKLKKFENKFLTEPYSSFAWLFSLLLCTMYDINLWYDKKFMANYGYPSYIFELNSSYNICPCVKRVKTRCLVILKGKQNKKCEYVVLK